MIPTKMYHTHRYLDDVVTFTLDCETPPRRNSNTEGGRAGVAMLNARHAAINVTFTVYTHPEACYGSEVPHNHCYSEAHFFRIFRPLARMDS